MDYLNDGDLVFFDDALYSQYQFIKKNIDELTHRRINCVVGVSPKLLRNKVFNGYNDIKSDLIHSFTNVMIKTKDDDIYDYVMNGLMTEDELKELDCMQNVYLALHGCCHLQLEQKYQESMVDALMIFKKDLDDGVQLFKDKFGYDPYIYVYPFAFAPTIFRCAVKANPNLIYMFACDGSYRRSIEDLMKYGDRAPEHS